MEPIVLIHGYSAESADTTEAEIRAIYGSLPAELREMFGPERVVAVNVGRYVSLDDRVDLDDVTIALDRVLKRDFPDLLKGGFNAIIHSTGALVMRNWIRRYQLKPSPIRRLIHMAGANLGSGWAHVGESELARWLRFIGQGGAQRGLAVLDALELASPWTIDLHRHFLQDGNSMLDDYGVMEFCIIGTQVPAEWRVIPIRYGGEDGADGVVRVAACNLNFNYLRLGPVEPQEADGRVSGIAGIDWDAAAKFANDTTGRADAITFNAEHSVFAGGYYEVKEDRRPEGMPNPQIATHLKARPRVPFAIPYHCAHSTNTIGVVYGSETKEQRRTLLKAALEATPETYTDQIEVFDKVTRETYESVRDDRHKLGNLAAVGGRILPGLNEVFERPQEQYDRHAQLVMRVWDQNGKPVRDYSVFFNSFGGGETPRRLINDLFEDRHTNNGSRHCTAFYLRLEAWDPGRKDWVDRLAEVNGVDLEIDVLDTQTNRILFVPLRMRIPAVELQQWIQPHRTTVIDVELLRLPAADTFILLADEPSAG